MILFVSKYVRWKWLYTCWLFLTKKRTAAVARVAWPQRGTSEEGVNHLRENRDIVWNTSISLHSASLLPISIIDDTFAGTTKAVSDKFISVAIFCFDASEISFSSKHTAAGLPPNISYKHLY